MNTPESIKGTGIVLGKKWMKFVENINANKAFMLSEFVHIGGTDLAGVLAEPPVESESVAGSDLVDSQSVELTKVVSSGVKEHETQILHVIMLCSLFWNSYEVECLYVSGRSLYISLPHES